MKRYLALILAAAMLMFCITGCTGSGVRTYTDEDTEATDDASAEATDTDAEATEEPAKDYTYAYEAYDPDTLVMTINGLPVYWSEFFYWVQDAVSAIDSYFGEITDWSAACDFDETQSYQDYIYNYAVDSLIQYRAMESKANELGLELTDEDQEYFDEIWESNIEYFGSEEELNAQLDSLFLTRDLYDYLNSISSLYEHGFDALYGENGENVSDEETLDYAEENGYLRVKHILIKNIDDEGLDLDDETIAANLETINSLRDQLLACTDNESLEALFDELAEEYSEDTGLASYPDGYCFTDTSGMDEDFLTASQALGNYELSDVVESSFGYHIILRLPVTADDIPVNDGTNTLRYICAQEMYAANLDSWIDEAEVVFEPGFENIDLSTIYG